MRIYAPSLCELLVAAAMSYKSTTASALFLRIHQSSLGIQIVFTCQE
jgi:hypothetical protein